MKDELKILPLLAIFFALALTGCVQVDKGQDFTIAPPLAEAEEQTAKEESPKTITREISAGTIKESQTSKETQPAEKEIKEPELIDSGSEIMTTDGIKHTVELEAVLPGCGYGKHYLDNPDNPERDGLLDCIHSIDNPKYVSAEEADKFLKEDSYVIGINYNNSIKAFPLMILDVHEIVNDYFGDEPVLITYCPLCGTSLVFKRKMQGLPVSFGVSGRLYNSDLVMYDRETYTFWSQVSGEGIIGPLAGKKLIFIPSETALWKDWKEAYPETKVLSTDTGFGRKYGYYPYGNYQTSKKILFPIENLDERYHSKTITYGILSPEDKKAKAYIEEDLFSIGQLNDTVGNLKVFIFQSPLTKTIKIFNRKADDKVLTLELKGDKIIDKETSTEWNLEGKAISGKLKGKELKEIHSVRGFFFAWFAFYPDSELHVVEEA